MEQSKLTYAEAVAEVEKIISRLRSEQTGVDTLQEELSRALELIARCKEQLHKVESAVEKQLTQEQAG